MPSFSRWAAAYDPQRCTQRVADDFLHDPESFHSNFGGLTRPPFLSGESTRFTFGKEARVWCRRGPGLILRMASVVGRETWDVSNVE